MTQEAVGKFQFYYQLPTFPLGRDSLALGQFATVKPGSHVCDLGTGSGILLLLLANREERLSLTGVEIQPESVHLAQKNMEENGLDAHILEGDLRKTTLKAGSFDLVISNPPYFKVSAGKVANGARSELDCTLEELCQTAGRLLKNGGRFALVHRPERLVDIFASLRKAGIEPKRMKFLAHSPQHTPSAVLIEGVRQGKPGLIIETTST